jgi:NAD(P)-dependent dehydrogenase (short-subunit alcohol dehydrogenase family)
MACHSDTPSVAYSDYERITRSISPRTLTPKMFRTSVSEKPWRHQPVEAERRRLQKELNVKSEGEARRLPAKKNSLSRMGKPAELANATVFLCSEGASYIRGVSLNMDGGRLKSLW